MHLSNKVCGFYKIEAIKVKDGKEISKRIVADWFPNLITNAGLDRIGTNNDFRTYCIVGSGNTAPANTDSTLATKVAHTNTVIVGSATTGTQTTSPYYNYWRQTYRFATGVAAGNLAEVGVGWTTTLVMSRALILDGGGSPTTITILSDEILDVSYEYRVYPKETDATGTVTFTGNLGGTYDWTMRAANADDASTRDASGNRFTHAMNNTSYLAAYVSSTYDSAMGAITANPTGTRISTQPITFGTYTAGDYLVTGTIEVTVAQGNYTPAGIQTFYFPVGCTMYQLEFDPVIPKTSNDTVSITFTVSWGRL